MYEKILVPISDDDGTHTDAVLEVARVLVAQKAEITLLHVIESIPNYALTYIPEGVLEKGRQEMSQMLRDVAGRLGRGCQIVVKGGHIGRAILDYASANGTDCIVMRSHRPELQDVIFGSTAAHVVRHAACSVHVVR